MKTASTTGVWVVVLPGRVVLTDVDLYGRGTRLKICEHSKTTEPGVIGHEARKPVYVVTASPRPWRVHIYMGSRRDHSTPIYTLLCAACRRTPPSVLQV